MAYAGRDVSVGVRMYAGALLCALRVTHTFFYNSKMTSFFPHFFFSLPLSLHPAEM